MEPDVVAVLSSFLAGDRDGSALWDLLVAAECQALRAEAIEVPAGLPTPYYQRENVTVYHGQGDVVGLQLARAGMRGLVFFDPAYSPHVHESARSNGKRHGVVGSRKGGTLKSPANRRRKMEIDFAPLSPQQRRSLARAAVALADGWIATFADTEGTWLWRLSLEAAGAEYVREGSWRKLCSTPQVSGDRPAVSREAILLHHALKPNGEPMAKRWNGGGLPADYQVPIVLDRGGRSGETRVHTTQKPEELMRLAVRDFLDAEDEDEPVIDLTAGSGTTGIGAAKNGRRSILIEREESCCEDMAVRFDAFFDCMSHKAATVGQLGLFARGATQKAKGRRVRSSAFQEQ